MQAEPCDCDNFKLTRITTVSPCLATRVEGMDAGLQPAKEVVVQGCVTAEEAFRFVLASGKHKVGGRP